MFVKSLTTSHKIALNLVVMVVYLILAQISSLLAFPGTNASPVWPPSGIALAAMLLFGYSMSIGITLASTLVNFFILSALEPDQHSTLTILTASFLTGLGASLQAMMGRFLTRKFISYSNYFTKPLPLLKFLLIMAFTGLINANIGPTALTLGGWNNWNNYFEVFSIWWVGDVAGMFVITPLFLSWVLPAHKKVTLGKILEYAVLALAIFLITWATQYYKVAYLYLAVLIWSALSFSIRGTTLTIFIIVLIVTLETAKGRAQFVSESLYQTILLLELFTIVISGITLLLSVRLEKEENEKLFWQKSTHGLTAVLKNFYRKLKKK